jgi:hypothetical protein
MHGFLGTSSPLLLKDTPKGAHFSGTAPITGLKFEFSLVRLATPGFTLSNRRTSHQPVSANQHS